MTYSVMLCNTCFELYRSYTRRYWPGGVLLILWLFLTMMTASALECPPEPPPVLQLTRSQECKAEDVQLPSRPERSQSRSCDWEARQACPPPQTSGGTISAEARYTCDEQTGQIVGASHEARSDERCACRFKYQCKLENQKLAQNYEARVAAWEKEKESLYAQQRADLQKCEVNLERVRKDAERMRAERRAEYERQRQECARQADEEAQRQVEAERQQKEQAVKDHLRAFEAAMGQGDYEEAADQLKKVRGLDPETSTLADAERRLGDVVGQDGYHSEFERKQQEAEEKRRQYAGELVEIPGGTFRMGDMSGDGGYDEKPVHSVTVPAFRMGKYEVTLAQWDACVADGGCGGYTPDDEGWGRGIRPVINVSWDDVQDFISWLNARTGGRFRLPSEAEWEYAVRAGSTTKYSWGNDIGQNRANCDIDYCGDRWEYTAPAGSFSANASGLYDMHGNVWEWTEDCWNDSYAGAPTDGSAWMSGGCGRRVVRGGSWNDSPGYLRSADRRWDTRSYRDGHIGFRLAQDK